MRTGQRLVEESIVKSTQRVYEGAWAFFQKFREAFRNVKRQLSTEDVFYFLVFLKTVGMARKADQHVAAISWFVRRQGWQDPTVDKKVKLALQRICRLDSKRQERIGGKKPFPIEVLRY